MAIFIPSCSNLLPGTSIFAPAISAFKLGSIKAANMVALGAFVAKTGLVAEKTVLEVIKDMVPKDKTELLRLNIAALKEGQGLVKVPFKKEVF